MKKTSRFLAIVTAAALSIVLLSACQQSAPVAPAGKSPSEPAAQPAAQPAQPTAPPAKPAAAPAAKVDFPAKGKSITVIHPFAAGAASDAAARQMLPFAEKELGVPIQLVNKPGAGGQTAYAELAAAKPDGYTIGFVHLPGIITIYQDAERQATFTRKNFEPLAMWVYSPGGLTVPKDSKYKTVKDVMDDAKANPEKVKAAVTGKLNPYHLLMLELQRQYGTRFALVFVNSMAEAVTAMLGGNVDVYPDAAGDVLSHVKNGNLRQLGIMDSKPSKYYPDIQTMEQLGYKMSAASTRGLAAPAGTPKEIVDVLAAAFQKAILNEEQQAKLDALGAPIRYMDPKEFAKYWEEQETWSKPLVDLAKEELK